MSEHINNSQFRKQKLQALIKSLHEGKSVDEVKQEFAKHFRNVSTAEIAEIEQALVKEGLPVEEVQRLCDVHASVFDGSIADIHKDKDYRMIPGHPAHVFQEENRAITQLIEEEIKPHLKGYVNGNHMAHLMLRVGFDRLQEIDRHYGRKEYLFFPFLEEKGITAPPKVMWAIDDEIRREIKDIITLLSKDGANKEEVSNLIEATLQKVLDMVFKEDNILIPLLLDTFGFVEWVKIDKATPEYGYTLMTPAASWDASSGEEQEVVEQPSTKGEVKLDAGSLAFAEVNAILNTLPFDMTFVDKDDKVKYFTQGAERIFERPKTIIGRNVSMCHPPHSVHIVEAIVADFKSGKKDHEDFWIQMKDMFVHIRYFAVRNQNKEYLGTLEVTQNIKPIRDLQGEKRLRS